MTQVEYIVTELYLGVEAVVVPDASSGVGNGATATYRH